MHSRQVADVSHVMRLTILHNIADAMRHLHSRTPKICHRDLKPRNCLMASIELNSNRETVDPTDPSSPRQIQIVCKLADFGESRSVVVSATGRDNLGNPLWLAPEVIRSEVCPPTNPPFFKYLSFKFSFLFFLCPNLSI
jgi:serine/threonine protein kinase